MPEEASAIDVYYDMDIAQICQHFNKSRNTVDKAIAKLVKIIRIKIGNTKIQPLVVLQLRLKVLKDYLLILGKKNMNYLQLKWNLDLKMKSLKPL